MTPSAPSGVADPRVLIRLEPSLDPLTADPRDDYVIPWQPTGALALSGTPAAVAEPPHFDGQAETGAVHRRSSIADPTSYSARA
jgi:hypothetical protein